MDKRILAVLFLTVLFFQRPVESWAFKLLDNKLDVRGSLQQTMNILIHEEVRDIRYSSFRTMARLDALFESIRTQELSVKYYLLANYYFDEVLAIDSDLRSAIRNEAGKNKFKYYRRPRNSDEWLTELYADVIYKNFQVRLGKQIVSWGDVADAQVADVINPLDNKYRLAFPDWEDYKLGLWMVRMFYTPPNWWQDLSFELIVIPFDFEETRFPPAPGLIGLPVFPNFTAQKMMDAQRSDAPKDGHQCFEIGMRIRGYSSIFEGIDWTISHFYSRLDTPLVDGDRGASNIVKMMFGGRSRDGKTYTYPYYNSTALTASTTWDAIGAAVRTECAYNTNRDYQYGTSSVSGGIKEKDLITATLKFSFSGIMVPYYSDRMFGNKNRAMSFSLTFSQYWMKNHEYNKHTGEYIMGETKKDPRLSKVAWAAMWFFNNDEWIVNYFGSYDSNSRGSHITGLMYKPDDHWTFSASYMKMAEAGISRYMDQVVLNVRYEFY